MAIEVAGNRFVTLADEFFVNGAKVYEAYANGVKVYPDEEEPYSDLLEGYVEQPLYVANKACGFETAARNIGIGVTDYYLSEQFTGEFVGTAVWYPDSGAVIVVMASDEPFTATRHWQSGKYDFDSGTKTVTYDSYSDFEASGGYWHDNKKAYFTFSNTYKSDWRKTNPQAAVAISSDFNELVNRIAWAMVYDLRNN